MNESESKSKKHEGTTVHTSTLVNWAVAIAAILILFNQWQLFQLSGMIGSGPTSGASASIQLSSGGEKTILTPVLLSPGEQPVISGYGTKIKELPTISSQAKKAPTGDAVQDAVNTLVPTGTPEYGQAAGVSFDDPLVAQKTWGAYERSIQLTAEQQQRWNKIVGVFTCDYCCGSPQQPTIITHCGCAHAKAWRGMAKWFIVNMGDKVSDVEIMGELAKWKTLWYPGPTIKRVMTEEAQSGGKTGGTVDPSNLPQMVGGC